MLRDAMDKAAEQALRAGQIIRRLRDFVARGESERRVESVKKLIERASAGAGGSQRPGRAGPVSIRPAVDLVLADKVQVQQVLLNDTECDRGDGSVQRRELVIAAVPVEDDSVEISVPIAATASLPK